MDKKHAYIRDRIVYELPVLKACEQHRQRDDLQPFVEPEIGKFLALLVYSSSARRVLELGTGIGYSTLWLAHALDQIGGTVTTIDNHQRTHAEAVNNFARSGLQHAICPIQGSIEEVLPDMCRKSPGSFDMIFQDAGKHLYPLMYENVYTLLAPGGILVTDDVLFPVEQSVREGLKRHVEAFNEILLADERYYTSVLPAGHGIAVSWKRK